MCTLNRRVDCGSKLHSVICSCLYFHIFVKTANINITPSRLAARYLLKAGLEKLLVFALITITNTITT